MPHVPPPAPAGKKRHRSTAIPDPIKPEPAIRSALKGIPTRYTSGLVRVREAIGDLTLIRYLAESQAGNQRVAPGTTRLLNEAAEQLQKDIGAALDKHAANVAIVLQGERPMPGDFGGPHAPPVDRIADVVTIEELRARRADRAARGAR